MANKDYKVGFVFGAKKASTFDKTFKGINNSIGGIVKGMAGIGTAYLSFGKVKDLAAQCVQEAKDQISVETKLEAVLQNVTSIQEKGNDAYKKATQNLVKVADKYEKIGVIAADVTIAGMQQLATFQLSDKEISTLTEGMTDLLAQQKGINASQQDAVGIGNMIGKVMNGQVSALSRVGISFDKSQEKALKLGTAEEKAAVLAEVLKQNVGGVNKALAETDDGKLKQVDDRWGEIRENIGRKILPLQAKFASLTLKALPAIGKVGEAAMDKLNTGLDWIIQKGGELSSLFKNNGIAGAIEKMFGADAGQLAKKAEGYATTFMGGFKKVLSGDVAGGTGEILSMMGFDKKSVQTIQAFAVSIGGAFKKIGPMAMTMAKAIGKGIQAILPTVKSAINFFAQKVLPVVQRVVGFITGTILPKMVSYFQTNIPKIGQIISNVWSVAKPILSFFADGISAIWSVAQPVISYLAGAFSGLGTGIMSTLSGITGFISGIFTGNWAKAWDGVKQIFRGFAEALIGIFKTPINAIIGLINKAIQGINSLHIDIPDWVPGLGGKTFGINIPEIPLLAKGGIATAPTLSVVGEGREKEAILPLSKLDGMLSQQAQGVVQTVNIAPVMALLKRFLDRPQQPAQQVQYVFAPQIAGGGREKEEIREMLRDEYPEFCRMMDRYEKDRRRKPLNPGR